MTFCLSNDPSHTIKADLITCPPDSSRMWEERGRGSPFFSQFICGGGFPAALHSIFIDVSTKAVSFSVSSLLPLIAGGTTSCRKREREGGGVCVTSSNHGNACLPFCCVSRMEITITSYFKTKCFRYLSPDLHFYGEIPEAAQ